MEFASQWNAFAEFGQRKRPVITYKKKPRLNSTASCNDDALDSDNELPLVSCRENAVHLSNTTCRTQSSESSLIYNRDDKLLSIETFQESSIQCATDKKATFRHESDVFDFPDQEVERTEVEIMVAKSLPIAPENAALTKEPKPTPRKCQGTRHSLVETSNVLSTLPQRLPTKHSTGSFSGRQKRYSGTLDSRPSVKATQVAHPGNVTNSTMAPATTATPKKRSHLVSRLKSVDGKCTTTSAGYETFDWFNDDDSDPDELAEDFPAPLPRQRVDGNDFEGAKNNDMSYKERMEQELESIMRSEFGQEEEINKQETLSCRRPELVSHAPITYQRSHTRTLLQQDETETNLLHWLDVLRDKSADEW